MNYSEERNAVWNRIKETDTFFIYGAQVIAYGVYIAIKEVLGKEPIAFLVSSIGDNPSIIDRIPVIELNKNIRSSSFIIVATPEIYHEEIKKNLEHHGYNNCLYVDTHMEYLIMSKYFRKTDRFKLLEEVPLLENMTNAYFSKKTMIYLV
jgi:hypothetical protein